MYNKIYTTYKLYYDKAKVIWITIQWEYLDCRLFNRAQNQNITLIIIKTVGWVLCKSGHI